MDTPRWKTYPTLLLVSTPNTFPAGYQVSPIEWMTQEHLLVRAKARRKTSNSEEGRMKGSWIFHLFLGFPLAGDPPPPKKKPRKLLIFILFTNEIKYLNYLNVMSLALFSSACNISAYFWPWHSQHIVPVGSCCGFFTVMCIDILYLFGSFKDWRALSATVKYPLGEQNCSHWESLLYTYCSFLWQLLCVSYSFSCCEKKNDQKHLEEEGL